MEFFERTEVYSKIFPNATPAAMEKEADELLQTAIARGEINELPPFSEFVENLRQYRTEGMQQRRRYGKMRTWINK